MLQVHSDPKHLIVNKTEKLYFHLTNTSNGIYTNIVFNPAFPNQWVILKKPRQLSVSRLEAGETVRLEFSVCPKAVGEWTVTSRNFSYRDEYGQSVQIGDLHLIVKVEVGAKPTPEKKKYKAPPRKPPGGGYQSACKKILILAANPKDTSRIRFDEEIREIEDALIRAKKRWLFDLKPRLAVRYKDLRRELLDYEPQVVHFIGHGEKEGLMVEDAMGKVESISPEVLSGLFELCADHVQCVILGSCYSAPQAHAISEHIDYVIGMRDRIPDKAAIGFAIAFYDALSAGQPVEKAFVFGCLDIKQAYQDIPVDLIPMLLKKNH